jgi:hypothetical protein
MKATVSFGYRTYLMDVEKAVELLALLDGAEVFESKWVGSGGTTAYYAYPQESNDHIREMKIIPDAIYRIAKLAGKPTKE